MDSKELTIKEYRKELENNIKIASYQYSISKLSPEKWLENEINEYVKQLISSINQNKKVWRITLIDDKEKFEDVFLKQIIKGYVDYAKKYLNNNSLELKKAKIKKILTFKLLGKELLKDTLVAFGIIHSNIDTGAFLIWQDKNKKTKAIQQTISDSLDYMGNSYDEILIYNDKICCVRYNGSIHVIIETYSGKAYVDEATQKWNNLKTSIESESIKGISVYNYLKTFNIDMKNLDETNNYLLKYQPHFFDKSYENNSDSIIPTPN